MTEPLADDPISAAVRPGYDFEGEALELGGLMLDAERLSDVPVRIPLAMLNRHGLVAGATGTGKTKTLQLLAEQLSAHGVPVFAADIKGDLSGISVPGEPSEKLTARAAYPAGPTRLTLGAVVHEGSCAPEPLVGIPLAMANRHGLIAGATGTGKTKTLQLLAEQCSAAGVPVFLADVKGDLSGLAVPGEASERVAGRARETGHAWTPGGVPVFAADIKGDLSGIGVPGEPSEKLAARAASVGQDWTATGFPTELFAIGGEASARRCASR